MKNYFRNLSLRGKLTFLITSTSCLVLILTLFAIIALQWFYLRNDLLQDTQVLGRGLSEDCAVAMVFDDRQAASSTLNTLAAISHVAGASLFDNNHHIYAEFHNPTARYLTSGKLKYAQNMFHGYAFSVTHLDVYEPVIYEGERLGQLMIRVDLAKVHNVLMRYVWIGLAVVVFCSLFAFLLANKLQRLISEPIKSLALSMQTVSKDKNYSYRVEKISQDELGSLFDGFNEMLVQIEQRDIELLKNEKNLNYLAYHDALTKLPNRLLFQDRLEHSLARARREKTQLAVLFIDLDRFKNVNDSLGHDAGDEVLRIIAARLDGMVRNADTLARLGGDEFVVILEPVNKQSDARRYVEKMLDAISQPVNANGHKLHMKASVGISIFPDNGNDIESLMKTADIAMYKAKEKGHNLFQFYSAEMNANSIESLLLENQLGGALGKDQLQLYYQPQFDLGSGDLIGFEALIRWHHPDHGIVSPLDFIPIAEESGLIIPIGEWIVHTACAQIKSINEQWQQSLKMAVNISPRQFVHPSLVPTVAAALAKNDLDPRFLELEVTESMAMDNVDQAIAKMDEINQMGVEFAIDDFGTGYSSLQYLKKFPISKLKIDKSFVKELELDINDTAIICSVIALGKSMGLEVIAEGIESSEQLETLKSEGCDQGQGYLFSKPVPASALPELLKRWCRNV